MVKAVSRHQVLRTLGVVLVQQNAGSWLVHDIAEGVEFVYLLEVWVLSLLASYTLGSTSLPSDLTT